MALVILRKKTVRQLKNEGNFTAELRQKREIQRFLKGLYCKDVDSFQVYQWIERCHFHQWWRLGISLSSYIMPDSLNPDYQKRLDFFLKEFSRNMNGNS
jgi:hypothetical protein